MLSLCGLTLANKVCRKPVLVGLVLRRVRVDLGQSELLLQRRHVARRFVVLESKTCDFSKLVALKYIENTSR